MLGNLAQRIADELQRHLPPLAELAPTRELQTALQAALRRMDLVTREEFDAQAAVLQRTRLRLESLEQQLAQWEQQTSVAQPSGVVGPPDVVNS
jgi:BMFP domain-containing protein YqiC